MKKKVYWKNCVKDYKGRLQKILCPWDGLDQVVFVGGYQNNLLRLRHRTDSFIHSSQKAMICSSDGLVSQKWLIRGAVDYSYTPNRYTLHGVAVCCTHTMGTMGNWKKQLDYSVRLWKNQRAWRKHTNMAGVGWIFMPRTSPHLPVVQLLAIALLII